MVYRNHVMTGQDGVPSIYIANLKLGRAMLPDIGTVMQMGPWGTVTDGSGTGHEDLGYTLRLVR